MGGGVRKEEEGGKEDSMNGMRRIFCCSFSHVFAPLSVTITSDG